MKYKQEIEDAFSRLGFSPRVGQIEAVNKILIAFLDNKKCNVILSAPTGTGKSLIGAIVAETLSTIKNKTSSRPKASISLVSTNVLSAQYGATFENLLGSNTYTMLKGAGNYPCSALSTIEEQITAESCAWYTMIKSADSFDDVINNHCNHCEFFKTKQKKNSTRHLTTNYSYFFVDRMYSGKFENRDLLIWDEAHLVNDLFSEHNAIVFSEKRILGLLKDVAETIALTDVEVAKTLKVIAKDCTIKDKINESNYKAYLTSLVKIYTLVATKGNQLAEQSMRSNKLQAYSKYSKFARRYEGLASKIEDLFSFDYEHVLDYKVEDASVSIKPIFVGKMTAALQCADHNLFMSATLSNKFLETTLHLKPEETEFIQLPPTFPKQNKEIVFFDTISLSYQSLQNPDTIKRLTKNVANCVKKHVNEGERGIILTPSFKLQNDIVGELKNQSWASSYKLFEHRQGEKLEFVLEAFKNYTGGSAVLISPSIYEGIDLSGDLSRFQVIVKAPFPSLADKRMKFILDNHKDLYEILTIQKLVQGAGRSVRSIDDHATTYILDLNAQRLMTSKANIWADEFIFRFTKFIQE